MVEEAIPGAVMSAVNLSEVVAKLAERGMPAELIRRALGNVKLEILSFDTVAAFDTGMLRVPTRHLGLSFGDRACIALGQSLGLPVLTTDKTWKSLDADIEIRVIR